MPPSALLLVVLVVAIFVAVVATRAALPGSSSPVRRKELEKTKERLIEAETLIEVIREVAYRYDEVDHALSSAIRGMVAKYKENSLRRGSAK